MYRFYSAGFLHQIRKLNVKPVPNSTDLQVNLIIEALSLPTAVAENELPKESGHVLQLEETGGLRSDHGAKLLRGLCPA